MVKTLVDLDNDVLLEIFKTIILSTDCADTVLLAPASTTHVLQDLGRSQRHIDFTAVHPKLDALYAEAHARTLIYEHRIPDLQSLDPALPICVPAAQVHCLRLVVYIGTQDLDNHYKPRPDMLTPIKSLITRFNKLRGIEVFFAFQYDVFHVINRVRDEYLHKFAATCRRDLRLLCRYNIKLLPVDNELIHPARIGYPIPGPSPSSVKVTMCTHDFTELTMRRTGKAWRMGTLNLNVEGWPLVQEAAALGWHVRGEPRGGRATRVIPMMARDGRIEVTWVYEDVWQEAKRLRERNEEMERKRAMEGVTVDADGTVRQRFPPPFT